MKKVFAILLAMLLAIGMMTGCSQAELTALSAYTEMAAWETQQQSGTITAEINKEQLAKLIGAFAAEWEADISAEEVNEINSMIFQSLKIDYTAEAAVKAQKIFMDFDVTLDGELYPLEVYFDGNKITVAKETLSSAMKFMEKYSLTENETYTYMEFLNDYAGNKDGVSISLGDDVNYYTEQKNVAAELGKNVTALAADFIKTAFSDYTSSLSSPEGNGVKFEVNYEKLVKEFGSLLGYYIGHKDKIANAWDTAVTAYAEVFEDLFSYHGADVEVAEDTQEFLPEMKADSILPSAADLTDGLDSMQEALNESPTLKEIVNGANLICTITPTGKDEYDMKYDVALPYQGVDMITINITDHRKKIDKIAERQYDLAMLSDFDTEYESFIDRQYPVKSAELHWYEDEAMYGDITFYRKNLNYTSYRGYSWAPFIEIDDRIYVPMRTIAEGLGYEVQWDNENEKAYVLDGDNRIDMSGLVHADRTYIKVRDFEKLGCRVDYVQNGSLNTATVTKPEV